MRFIREHRAEPTFEIEFSESELRNIQRAIAIRHTELLRNRDVTPADPKERVNLEFLLESLAEILH